ncbi:MAG: APC family permease, partial [Clostridia bacterium]|nr:APC family permease [Clostridia bacterium]
MVGKNYAYYVGWFLATMYYPSMTSVLAWVSSRYLCVLLGFSVTGAECLTIAGFFLIASYVLNTISPILAGKFQVSTTVIKMVPLALMAVVGIIVGLVNGMTVENFTTVVDPSKNPGMALFTAVVATAFTFEGWIIATSINAELKDAKKNLPRALVIGTLIVAATYILYYIGLSGTVTNAVLMESGEAGVRVAFETLFSRVGGTVLSVLVVISCLGTLNGLMLGTSRGMYAIAVRGRGPAPKVFSQVDPTTDMPTNSAVLGLFFCAFWLLYFYGSQLTSGWFGFFRFDSSELPIITIYAAYLPIFFIAMKKEQSLSKLQRFGAFPLAALGSIFMVVAAIFAHSATVVSYLVAFVIFMVIGFFFRKEQKI